MEYIMNVETFLQITKESVDGSRRPLALHFWKKSVLLYCHGTAMKDLK